MRIKTIDGYRFEVGSYIFNDNHLLYEFELYGKVKYIRKKNSIYIIQCEFGKIQLYPSTIKYITNLNL